MKSESNLGSKPWVIRILASIVFGLIASLNAQIYDTNNVFVQTFAGSGFYGYLDGTGTQTMFYQPIRIVADPAANLFVFDSQNARIRKIAPDATVSTFVGGGPNQPPGYGTNVSIPSQGFGMTIDHSNTIWLTSSSTLLRIASDGCVSQTNFISINPWGLCVDSGNNLYISDYYANKIYRYRTNGVLELFVGSGNPGGIDGNGVFTSFYFPSALVADAADNIYVWDSGNSKIRKITPSRDVTTITGSGPVSDGVGTNASFTVVSTMTADSSGNIILACGSSVRKITAATNVLTLAGVFSGSGYTNGPGYLARFQSAAGVCVTPTAIFVADAADQRIREITFNPVENPVTGADLELNTYPGLKISGVVGRSYRIESSTNMSTWTSEATLLLTRSPYLWFDENAVGQKKFYRAFLLP